MDNTYVNVDELFYYCIYSTNKEKQRNQVCAGRRGPELEFLRTAIVGSKGVSLVIQL